MKPFNLKKALSGKKVVCANGKKVSMITTFLTKENELKVVAVIEGVPFMYSSCGVSLRHGEEDDLMMEEEIVYLNVFYNAKLEEYIIKGPYTDLALAIYTAQHFVSCYGYVFVKTIDVNSPSN